MEKKKTYKPGDLVSTFTGQTGIVISQDMYSKVKDRLKEGRRPGYYFAPGCCANPDYIVQVPVVFEDGSYDVMRSIQIKRLSGIPQEKKIHLQSILEKGDR